jgi:hypothetical protein
MVSGATPTEINFLSRVEKADSPVVEELRVIPVDAFKAVWILDIRNQSLKIMERPVFYF